MKGFQLSGAEALKADDVGIVELVGDHLVALVGRNGASFEVVDSTNGEYRNPDAWSEARLENEWTGNVLLVKRTSAKKTR